MIGRFALLEVLQKPSPISPKWLICWQRFLSSSVVLAISPPKQTVSFTSPGCEQRASVAATNQVEPGKYRLDGFLHAAFSILRAGAKARPLSFADVESTLRT